MRYSPLLTDLYELTMLAGYLEEGMTEKPAVFDLYFRTKPSPKLKITGDIAKSTLPGKKHVLRIEEPGGGFIQDVVCLENEVIQGGDTRGARVCHPIPGSACLQDVRSNVEHSSHHNL